MAVRLPPEELMTLIDGPQLLLGLFVRKLEEIQSKLAIAVAALLAESEGSTDLTNEGLIHFYKCFTVNTAMLEAIAEPHGTALDPCFVESQFQIILIDSYAGLMELLSHVEKLCARYTNNFDQCIVVDFEGKASSSGWNRYGELCLMQMTVSDEPMRTYVIDIYVLREKAFSLQTPSGTSLKSLLEEPSLVKVWWDCRNDVDVLWNHYEILPNGVFDLQLAEVAKRRYSGIEARFVLGLQKALTNSMTLQSEQRIFSELVDLAGKKVYEPNYGGNYEMFKHRPLHPHILIYAAHDTRYQLLLHGEYAGVIGENWPQRVLEASLQRSRWGLTPQVVEPTKEAPDF
jgi:exonuclease 3'-5' domain-containing protein 1